jgi:hypothetical protein
VAVSVVVLEMAARSTVEGKLVQGEKYQSPLALV